MDHSKHKQKRRKISHHTQSGADDKPQHNRHPQKSHQKQHQQLSKIDRQKKHEEALALSQQLRQLSSQKRLKECINLYRSPTHDELRDAHHGSIVVDCCARCGDIHEAEKIVYMMLSRTKSETVSCPPYFWKEEHTHKLYKQVPIQAWTALLKGYVHSGMMSKADSLFNHRCMVHKSILSSSANSDKSDGGSKKRKRDADSGPNVRTLNTLLRGCLWTATSLDTNESTQLVGGVMTASKAWSLCEDVNIERDSSSYEYYISILSQSLQCKSAEGCLQKMKDKFGVSNDGKSPDDVDSSILESLVICLVVIARGYALMGDRKNGKRCAEQALLYLDMSAGNHGTVQDSHDMSSSEKHQQKTTGGKKAWARDDGNATGRREESNKLFRNHRLSELRSEVSSLLELCSQEDSSATGNTSHVAQFIMTRLLYFSGGGTTGKEATQISNSPTSVNTEEDIQQWMHSLWHSFGLRETIQRLINDSDEEDVALMRLLHPSSSKKKRKQKQLPLVLSKEMCDSLQTYITGAKSVISSDTGHIDFTQVFKPLHDDAGLSGASVEQNKKKLHIELGSGSGDWACLQAELNPSENYVTVELRADRVAQTFAKGLLHQQQTDGQNKYQLLTNLASVGSEAGSFLCDRIKEGSVQTIFVNHPEPPTQTYNAAATDEEPAHMLNSQTITASARCLEPNGKGRLIIVTDNMIYARLICQTVAHVLKNHKNLIGLPLSEVRDLRRVESFGAVHLYEGKPSSSIGHYIPSKFEGGTSYFDRLWRTGAGKHADMRKRFIIGIRTSSGNESSNGYRRATPSPGKHKAGQQNDGEGKKSSQKRNAEKQKRRNERRLLKKQQQLEQK